MGGKVGYDDRRTFWSGRRADFCQRMKRKAAVRKVMKHGLLPLQGQEKAAEA